MDWGSFLLAVACIVVIYGIVQGWGDDRKIVVFKDYDDLGLTFLVPASGIAVIYVFSFFGASESIGKYLAWAVMLWVLSKLAVNTYALNDNDLKKTALALVTKLPLAIVWVLNLIQVINPSGKTAAQRSSSRGSALVMLAIMTPIIGKLVVDRSGSYFNPMEWLKGRRIGHGIRNHLS